MEVKTISDSFDVEKFNRIAPHPLQSWEWGEARRSMGIDVERIGEFERDTLQNVFQLTFHQVPRTPFTVGYLPRTVLPSPHVVKYLKEIAKKKKCIFIKIEPYVKKNDTDKVLFDQFLDNAKKSVHPLFPRWTQMLDIQKSEADLLKQMKSKTRYNIGLAERKGVTVQEMTNEEGYKIFERLYFETTKRQRYLGHKPAYHHVVFDTLKDTISHILVAFFEGSPLAAYHLFIFNDAAYYPYGGSSIQNKNVMAANLLMWEAIRFGKKAGCKTFDMWGSLKPDYDRSAPWAGFTRFKEGYGTEFIELVGSYDIVLNEPLYRVYNVADVLRKKIIL